MRRDGFTLLEVLVALAIGGIVLLTAERIFAGVGEGGRRLVAARAQLDREANGRRWLKNTFLSLELGQAGGEGFEGRADRVRFTAWQLAPGRWFERQAVDLESVNRRFVGLVGGTPLLLADSVTDVAFDYLLDPGADSHWVREWISPVSAPLAVRIRIQRGTRNAEPGTVNVDTLLFLIKERG